MTDNRTCPECHAEIPPDAPPGICPHCALRAGLHPETSAEPAREPGAPPSPDELRRRLPDLDEFELIGPGGMGTVYRARHRPLDRPVAVKVLHAHLQDDASFAERFTREARTMARLDHPHIVRVYDFGHREGLYYLVMELVDGVSLRQALVDGGFTPAEALAVVPRICEALQYAHDQGVVHRDIKPENILLDRSGSPKIVDFGLALLTRPAAGTRLTQQARVLGTPHYMAPEQIERPAEVDHRADIYALGVVFYEMLTGELPIGRFPAPSQKVEVDVRLDEVVLRTLEKEPGRRYQQARELSRDVEQSAAGAEANGGEASGAEASGAETRRRGDQAQDQGWTPARGRHRRDRAQDQSWTPARGGRRRSRRRRRPDFEYRSTRTLWGLPLVHIAHNREHHSDMLHDTPAAVARGIVAIGDVAIGLVAIGGFAIGGVAIGGMTVGILSLGLMAAGLLIAVGCMAGGAYAAGFMAWGVTATGWRPRSLLDLSAEAMQWVSFSAFALLTAVVALIAAGLIIWWQDAGDGESPRECDDAGNGEGDR